MGTWGIYYYSQFFSAFFPKKRLKLKQNANLSVTKIPSFRYMLGASVLSESVSMKSV